MPDSMWNAAFSSVMDSELTLPVFLLCTLVSLALGVGTAMVNRFRARSSQGFAVTLAILPGVVQVVIMLVNGNLGAGVAVAGAFGLVRFRSAPGTAREIGMLFLAMAIGLATGMGYLLLAVLAFLLIAAALLGLTAAGFGRSGPAERVLKITIPENLDYEGLFDDLFQQYTREAALIRVKTASMGTLYELEYRVVLREERVPKEFLDALRCRNGNLNIVCSRELEREAL